MKENVLLPNSKTFLRLYHLLESEHCQWKMNPQRERHSRRSIVDQNTAERGNNYGTQPIWSRLNLNENRFKILQNIARETVTFFIPYAYRIVTGSLIVSERFQIAIRKSEQCSAERETHRGDAKPQRSTKRLLLWNENRLKKTQSKFKISRLVSRTCRGVHFVHNFPVHGCFNECCFIIGNEVTAPFFMPQKAVAIETSDCIVIRFPYLVDTSLAISQALQIRKLSYEVCVPMTTRLKIGSRRSSEKCRKICKRVM